MDKTIIYEEIGVKVTIYRKPQLSGDEKIVIEQGDETMTLTEQVTSIVLQDLNNGGPIARTLRR